MHKRLHWAFCASLILLASPACTSEESVKVETLSASQVCDNTLTPRSAKAIERLATAERFTELTGTNTQGDANEFSLELAAKRLHGDVAGRSICTIYKADDNSGIPLLRIEFEPTPNHPDPEEEARNGKGSRLILPLGSYAEVNGDKGANLYFACSAGGSESTSPYVRARMYSSPGQLAPASTPEDRMAILNDVSRALAGELGCADEAALPARVPEPSES